MADFSYLEKFDVNEKARDKFVFHEIPGKDDKFATLIVAPAGEPNKPYFSTLTRYAMKHRRSMQNNANILEETRNLDRKLYSEFVIKDWENIVDVKDQPVEFSKKRCAEFLDALPNPLFDRLREHCAELDNFSGIGIEDAEYAAKNLPSGSSGKSD